MITGNDQIEIFYKIQLFIVNMDATITNRSNQQINPSKLFVLGPLKSES